MQALAAGIDAQFSVQWFFVGAGDARELWDKPGSGFGVEAFGVPFLTDLKIGAAIDLYEISWFDQGTGTSSIVTKRRDKSRKSDHTGVEEEFGHFSDSSNIFDSVVV